MKKRILFIDDEAKVLMGLNRLLHNEAKKWDMAFLTSANEAKRLLTDQPYDAVLLDIEMPGKNGLELLAEIKADPKIRNTEVVVLTGLHDHALKRKALDLGATDLLNKPVQIEDLIARLNSALQIKSYHDELRAKNALLEQELIKSQKMELAGILASGATHDLRNILMAILGQSGLAARQVGKNSPLLENLKTIANTAGQAQRIVAQILDFSRQTDAPRRSADLGEIIDETLRLLSISIPTEVQVVWKRPRNIPKIIVTPTQIFQLLLNICINALQIMDYKGKLTIDLRISEMSDEVASMTTDTGSHMCLQFIVSSTSSALNANAISHIFDSYSSLSKEKDSHSLGLCVARMIVEGHGGTMFVKTDKEKGTIFTVRIPIFKEDERLAATGHEHD